MQKLLIIPYIYVIYILWLITLCYIHTLANYFMLYTYFG